MLSSRAEGRRPACKSVCCNSRFAQRGYRPFSLPACPQPALAAHLYCWISAQAAKRCTQNKRLRMYDKSPQADDLA